jgi:hypothetical protein
VKMVSISILRVVVEEAEKGKHTGRGSKSGCVFECESGVAGKEEGFGWRIGVKGCERCLG